MQKETICQSFSLHRLAFLRHDVHQQVHAISSKAADVRPMVMALNAKRQARDEAAADDVLHSDAAEDEPLLSEAEDDKHHHQDLNSDIDWQEYDEVRPPYQRNVFQALGRDTCCLHLSAIRHQSLELPVMASR